jgi:hypothetical protein
MIARRWARGANMRKPFFLPCVVSMAILVLYCINERPCLTGSMSGARATGSPAGSARVQYVGHPSTDSN